jgi:hypothetical protein
MDAILETILIVGVRIVTLPAYLLYLIMQPTTISQTITMGLILVAIAAFFTIRGYRDDRHESIGDGNMAMASYIIISAAVPLLVAPAITEGSPVIGMAQAYQPSALTTVYKPKSDYKKIYTNDGDVQFKNFGFDTEHPENLLHKNKEEKTIVDLIAIDDTHKMTATKNGTTQTYKVCYADKDITIAYDKDVDRDNLENAKVTIDSIYARKETAITKVHGEKVDTSNYRRLKIKVSVHATKDMKNTSADKTTIKKVMD